jgi:hypothetical protein
MTTAPKKAAPKRTDVVPLVLRLPGPLVASLDAWVARLNADATGPQWTRTDVIRTALTRAARERGAKGQVP